MKRVWLLLVLILALLTACGQPGTQEGKEVANDTYAEEDYFYLLNRDQLFFYDMSQGMKFIKKESLPFPFECLASHPSGDTYLPSPNGQSYMIQGEELKEIEGNELKYISFHPSGEWAINYYLDTSDTEKITIAEDGSISAEAIRFVDETGTDAQTYISRLFVFDDLIAITGSQTDTNDHVVGVYNTEGLLQVMLKNPEGESLGSIEGFTVLDDAYLGIDSNTRELYLWDKEGNVVDQVDLAELLGVQSPWGSDLFTGADGNPYIVCTSERPDGSSGEALVMKITVE